MDKTTNKIITIVGMGHVGTACAFLFSNAPFSCTINFVDPSDDTHGSMLDLSHSLALLENKSIAINDEELFSKSDYIIYTAGVCNDLGQSRLSIVQENIDLTKEIFDDAQFEKEPYIIIISNPVDVISYHTWKATGLPSNKIIGTGTLLDSSRLSYYLYNTDELKAFVLGEHGESQVPITSWLKDEFPKDTLDQAITKTKSSARQIRETQGYTAYAVAQCAFKIVKQLEANTPQLLPLSILTNTYYRNLFDLKRDIFISIPTIIYNNGIQISNESFNEQEIEQLKISAHILAGFQV